jgi:hypothetical protein
MQTVKRWVDWATASPLVTALIVWLAIRTGRMTRADWERLINRR